MVSELGWRLFVEKDENAALAGIRRALELNLATCLAITALVLLLTSLTINRFQSRLERTATLDGLTGFLNRPALGILADQAFREMKRDGRSLCLVIADLDDFKSVNDGFGHQTATRSSFDPLGRYAPPCANRIWLAAGAGRNSS